MSVSLYLNSSHGQSGLFPGCFSLLSFLTYFRFSDSDSTSLKISQRLLQQSSKKRMSFFILPLSFFGAVSFVLERRIEFQMLAERPLDIVSSTIRSNRMHRLLGSTLPPLYRFCWGYYSTWGSHPFFFEEEGLTGFYEPQDWDVDFRPFYSRRLLSFQQYLSLTPNLRLNEYRHYVSFLAPLSSSQL